MQISFNVFFLLILSLLTSLNFGKMLNKKTRCKAFGSDCDVFHWCCDPYSCRDYRCSLEDTSNGLVDFYPNGIKCDFFHGCEDGYVCESHRCIKQEQKKESK